MPRFQSRVNTGGKYMKIRQYNTKNGSRGEFKSRWSSKPKH